MAAVDAPTSCSAGAAKPCLHAQPLAPMQHQHQQASHHTPHLRSQQQQQQPPNCHDPPVPSSSGSNSHQNVGSSSHQYGSHHHHHLPFGHWDLGPGDIHLRGHPEVLLGYFLPGAVGGVALEAALHSTQLLLRSSPSGAVRTLSHDWRYALYVYGGRSNVYRGAWGNLLAGFLWSGLFGCMYVPVKQMVDDSLTLSPDAKQVLGPVAGASAGSLIASTVRTPLEVVRQFMSERGWRSTSRTFLFLSTRMGTSSLYRTWGSSVIKGMPVDALLFLGYELLKAKVEAAQDQALSAPQSFAVGGAAGAMAGLLTSPLELLGVVVRGGWRRSPIGLQQQLQTVLGKAGWTAFGGAVFFPCLEAASAFFDPALLGGASSTPCD